MPAKIEPNLRKIGEYLKIAPNEMFVIPEYQRRYSWTVTECDKLWQDVETFMESGTVNESGEKEPYFFGTIIADCSEQDSKHEICLIDGQQRTTTFILLLKALLLEIEGILNCMRTLRDEDSETLFDGLKEKRGKIVDILGKTDVDHRRGEFLKDWTRMSGTKLITSRSINELNEFRSELQTIVEAKTFADAEQRCHKIPRKQRDNKYTNYFRNFKFFVDRLSDCSDSHVNVFAKAFLETCQIIEIRSWNTEQAITMFNSLNSTGMPLSDSDIISAQLYSKAGEDKTAFNEQWENITRLADDLSLRKIANLDSLLQQYMYIQRATDRDYIRPGSQPDVTTPGLRRYFTAERNNLLRDPMAFCGHIEKIAKIWNVVSDWPVVKLLLKFNENAKLYLVSFLNRFDPESVDESAANDISESLLKLFAVLEVVDVGYSSAKFKTFLFGENIKLVDAGISADEIKQDFRNHIARNWQRTDIEDALREYDKNILVFLNEYLYAKTHGRSFHFDDSVNIEHIMPASGHNLEAIRQDAGIDTQEDFFAFVNSLGNKILLEEDINKSIGNDWFRTKKQRSVRDKKGYKDSTFGIALALTKYPTDFWTKADIEASTARAVSRISDFIFS